MQLHYNFNGTKINVFGKKEDTGKIAIVFKSEKLNYKIYDRQKIMGIWANINPRIFRSIYNVYKIKTEPGLQINRGDTFANAELGIANINFYTLSSINNAILVAEHKENFLKEKLKAGHYKEEHNNIKIWEDSDLFYTEIEIPASIAPGKYMVQVYLIGENGVKSLITIPLKLERAGILKKVKEMSSNRKFLYGGLAILISIVFSTLSYIAARVLYYNRYYNRV